MNPSLHSLKLRPFSIEDCASISEFVCRCLREVNSKDYLLEELERMIPEFAPEKLSVKLSPTRSVVAELNNRIVGTGTAEEDLIRTVFVDPDLHGRGVGKQIMNYLEEMMAKRGFQSARLTSSVTALPFYLALGYQPRGETYKEIGGRNILMDKVLSTG